jgi:hypothetical protein
MHCFWLLCPFVAYLIALICKGKLFHFARTPKSSFESFMIMSYPELKYFSLFLFLYNKLSNPITRVLKVLCLSVHCLREKTLNTISSQYVQMLKFFELFMILYSCWFFSGKITIQNLRRTFCFGGGFNSIFSIHHRKRTEQFKRGRSSFIP